jgi:flagellar M-ring protein FliF
MSDMKNVWTRMGTGGRVGLVVGVALIVLLVASLGYWALGKTFQPLFADLAEQDAATLVAELDRMKVPYRLEAGGQRIMVPEDMVPKTRLQLVSKNLPLHGSVGFEIFNNTDFGMSGLCRVSSRGPSSRSRRSSRLGCIWYCRNPPCSSASRTSRRRRSR